MAAPADDTAAHLRSASRGFDHIFSNEIVAARAVFDSTKDSSFHALGLGVCAFLEAALGMEVRLPLAPSPRIRCTHSPPHQLTLVAEANRLLALAEAGAKKQAKATKAPRGGARFPQGIEYELIHADTIILLGLTNAIRSVPSPSSSHFLFAPRSLPAASTAASPTWATSNVCECEPHTRAPHLTSPRPLSHTDTL